MKTINSWHIDSNNNKWSTDLHTLDQAKKLSKTLINCLGCSNCINCSYCSEFNSNPQIYQTKQIGSRGSQTIFYWNEDKNHIVCGCFRGDIIEFEAKVKSTYPARHKHRIEYTTEIKKFKMLAGIK